MAIQFDERPESRTSNLLGESPSVEFVFKSTGEQDDAAVATYALGATPRFISTVIGTLYRQDIRIQPDGYAQYVVAVPYGTRKRDVGDVSFDFDTTGGTVKRKASIEHIASYPDDPSNPNPLGGCLNVKEDGTVEGAEVVIPSLRFTIRVRRPAGVVTVDYVKILSNITGTTNSLPFMGFDAGELLFTGATGSDGTEAEAEIACHFVASANATGLAVGAITGVDKLGHDYLSTQTADAVVDGGPGKEVTRVHIDRVYNSANFAAIFGFGG